MTLYAYRPDTPDVSLHQDQSTRTLYLLVFDHSPAQRDHVAELLRAPFGPHIQCDVTTVESAAAAQVQASRQHYDLIVGPLDQGGLHLAQALHTLDSSMRLLLLAGPATPAAQRVRAQHLGATVLELPANGEKLRIAATHLLDMPASAQPVPTLLMTAERRAALRQPLLAMGRENSGVYFVVLADMSGQELVSWSAVDDVDTAAVAALSAGALAAAADLGQSLQATAQPRIIVQEHDERTVLLVQVRADLFLLLAITADTPLGWARVAVHRTVATLREKIAARADVPGPRPVR
jgi:predicted regulator of Ras-like GTPase activity (Roadblock/LC7/MglB family)